MAKPKMTKITCGDGSEFIIRYVMAGSMWVLIELYHELPMEGNPPCASTLTDLHAMIAAISCRELPLIELHDAIDAAIREEERPNSPDSFRESLLK
jgi:hypothetical protein